MKQFYVAGLVLASGALMAQTPAAAGKICVINLQSAMISTKEGQAAADSFTKRFTEPREKELQAKQTEINDLTDKLQRGVNTMSQTAQEDMKRTIDRKSTDYKRAVEDYQFDRNEEQGKLLEGLSSKMQSVIDRYAVDGGCTVVLDVTNPNTGVLWVATASEITSQVVDAYDKMQPAASAPKPPAASSAKPPATSPVKPSATPPTARPPAAPVKP